ncbi:MAG: hypothetical protein AB7T49_20870 [Oligoflexales bacterium]
MTTLSLEFIEEPLLAFRYGQTMEHPKDGLYSFGPPEHPDNPDSVHVGVIGTASGIKIFKAWGEKIKGPIMPDSDKPQYSLFPGFKAAFKADWFYQKGASIEISEETLRQYSRITDPYERVGKMATLYADQLLNYHRKSEQTPKVWFVIIPEYVFTHGRPESNAAKGEQVTSNYYLSPRQIKSKAASGQQLLSFEGQEEAEKLTQYEVNFRNQLKARLLGKQIVTQIIRETTLAPTEFTKANGYLIRTVQDAATIAWNLCTTAYFKSGGKPWKLADIRPGVCYIGLVFKRQRAKEKGNACCAAQMFLDSGDGLVFRGADGPWYSRETKEYHLDREAAEELIRRAVEAYRNEADEYPKELFIHSKGHFSDDEWQGFQAAVSPETKLVGVRIQDSKDIKLFREGDWPVIRGSALYLSDKLGYLWTRGFVARLDTYYGADVPNPILVEIDKGNGDLQQVMEDVMALTKVNFNACLYGDGMPVTLRFADRVGEILTSAPLTDKAPLPFKFYI